MKKTLLNASIFVCLLFAGSIFAQSVSWVADHDAELGLKLKSEYKMYFKALACPSAAYYELGEKDYGLYSGLIDFGAIGLTGLLWALYASGDPYYYEDSLGRELKDMYHYKNGIEYYGEVEKESNGELERAIVFSSLFAIWRLANAHFAAGKTVEYNKKLMEQYKVIYPSFTLKEERIHLALNFRF